MIAAVALAAAALAPAADAAVIKQLVVFRDGSAVQKRVTTRAATAKVGHKRCRIAGATPLAALVRSRIGALQLKDYGSCSRKARDSADLYVRSIRGERAHGVNGWVYKLGNRGASAGAANPSGPFGRGRLRRNAHLTWFYCHMSARTGSCQRTLALRAVAGGGGALTITVTGYDDAGHGRRVNGATVHAGAGTATTTADGVATLKLPAGRAKVWAEAPGAVRSFEERVEVK